MAADKTTAEQDAPKRPRRAISAKLKPVSGAAAKTAAKAEPTPKPPAPRAEPTEDQIATWQALEPNQKLALREREAVRMFGQGLEHHNNGDLEEAARIYGQALILDPRLPDIYTQDVVKQ